MTRIGIIIGSTRPGRKGETVAQWVAQVAAERGDAEFQLVDVAAAGLPLFDEPMPPMMGKYTRPHTLAWARTIASCDGFVVVTAEYNHAAPGALKNALDYLYAEWNDKAAGFVSYGSAGGLRAVDSLRLVMSALKVATVGPQVSLSLMDDFEDMSTFRPSDRQRTALDTLLDDVVAWTVALETVRVRALATRAA